MGRKPKVRTSYREDAAFLTRLGVAVENDLAREDEWRSDTLCLIATLTNQLLSADLKENEKENEDGQAERRQGVPKKSRKLNS